MPQPIRAAFGRPQNLPGMVVEEIAADAGSPLSLPFEGSRFSVPPGATSVRDEHAVAEIWLIRSGTGTVVSSDTSTEVGPGDALYYPPWVPHQVTNTGSGPLEVFSLWWTADA
ncbi:hypothetical protein SGFS_066730 [Streptomyces graminofaciens]|uniref:Cupin type-2 domain-containing protein n=1 Tax=Streptomyces graminofaciens TaxID=68212 RepID=A0ABM7FGP2_9ACTN|nr:cupin domain-containing protein [Streptomyces graminofaciens]BBC35379.1 hypothetical protein SGFS_066730 [Streptomyces graminofaciens]